MHKIDGPGATDDNEFAYGDAQIGERPTMVTMDWLNAVQAEIVNVILAAGLTLDKMNNAQLLAAIGLVAAGAVPDATTTAKGVVELATNGETQAGSDSARAVTPASLASLTATLTRAGLVELATTAEAVAGTDADRAVTPAGLKAGLDALVAAAPGALDTLDELANALGDDPNFATTVTNALAGKQALHAILTALSGLTTASNQGIYATGVNTFAMYALTAFGRTLAGLADAAAGRTAFGLGSVAVLSTEEARLLPRVTINANTTFDATHAGKVLLHTSGTVALTVETDANSPIPNESAITVQNLATAMTVTPAGGVTLAWLDGSGTLKTGARSIALAGSVTIWKATANYWTITGTGLS